MIAKFSGLIQSSSLFSAYRNFVFRPLGSLPPKDPVLYPRLLCTAVAEREVLPSSDILDENVTVEGAAAGEKQQKDSSRDVFRRWGLNDNEISGVFHRRPGLRNACPINLQSKLNLLHELGISSADLVKMLNRRPCFLSGRINLCFQERLEFFQELFGSREVLLKAIIRNPSFLTYGFHNRIKPVIATYKRLGLTKDELIPMLLSRPTVIPRTSINDEKLDYIRRTGVSQGSKLYKYVVTLFGISRLETIREKLANLEKFGLSEDEILRLLGRSPLLLTLSVEKVQRNMTFILGTMKLPASVVLAHPFLLISNLETILKPRVFLAAKIQDMCLLPQIKGPVLLTALRKTEKRFVEAFITCHPNEVAEELLKCYTHAKDIKRLAESSRTNLRNGFPF